MTSAIILAVLTGRAQPLGAAGARSAIAKTRRQASVRIGILGLDQDEQGDAVRHGGPEKAIHHYPCDHYARWSEEIAPPSPLLAAPGAFGENISTLGLTERNVCLGDIFRLGSALVQVSQGRQPFWRLNHRFGRASMARAVQASGRTGWYYRVREAGSVAAGDALVLCERPAPAWPLSRAIDLLYRRTLDPYELRDLLALPYCPPSWRALIERRLVSGTVESWQRRLTGAAD
jgi:MOSC domain-containing protein YiiM